MRLHLDNLVVDDLDKQITFSINDIQMLIIDNSKTTLSVRLINKLAENNVTTILCGIDHLPYTIALPINGNFESSGNISLQINWNKETKGYIQKEIVRNKILHQSEILMHNSKDINVINKIEKYADEVKDFDVTNREGLAAKMYFRELFGKEFIRFNDDVVNAGLNYGYAILRSTITSIIVGRGYLCNLGIFHKGKSNMFNLSDDIIEVFRPIVDNYVYNNMTEEIIFKQKHREELLQLLSKKIKIDSTFQTIPNAMSKYIDSILKSLNNDIVDIKFPSVIIKDDL